LHAIYRTAVQGPHGDIHSFSDEVAWWERRYEQRRMAALKMIEYYSYTLASRLKSASSVIEGEFTEAAE
jgi:hypothetical protein